MARRDSKLMILGAIAATCGIGAVLLARDPGLADPIEPPPLLAAPVEEVALPGAVTGRAPAVADAASMVETPTLGPNAFTPSREFQAWITDLVREHLPDKYEKKKNWGHAVKTQDGVSVQFKDGRLITHRTYKEVNDGTWQMVRVKLKNADRTFDVRVGNFREIAGGRVEVEITVVAQMEVFGRQSLWEQGVQLYSISAAADARVRLWARAEVATRLDPTRIPPDIYFEPKVTAARLDIPDFRLRRVGQFHGPLIRSLSHATREALEEKIREDNAKLVAALNKQISKQEKKLKLSLADVISHWSFLIGREGRMTSDK